MIAVFDKRISTSFHPGRHSLLERPSVKATIHEGYCDS